jgi:hypothetical protein
MAFTKLSQIKVLHICGPCVGKCIPTFEGSFAGNIFLTANKTRMDVPSHWASLRDVIMRTLCCQRSRKSRSSLSVSTPNNCEFTPYMDSVIKAASRGLSVQCTAVSATINVNVEWSLIAQRRDTGSSSNNLKLREQNMNSEAAIKIGLWK